MKTDEERQREFYELEARTFANLAEKMAALAEAFQACAKEINKYSEDCDK